jgi:hypothetical protein
MSRKILFQGTKILMRYFKPKAGRTVGLRTVLQSCRNTLKVSGLEQGSSGNTEHLSYHQILI